jgi:Protein phosphatase 2C
MSSAVPRDPGRDPRTDGGLDEAQPSFPPLPHRERPYINGDMLARLVADLVTHEEAERFPPRKSLVFDRVEAQRQISTISAVGADRAMEEARARDLVPPEPILPETEFEGDVETMVVKVRGYSHYLSGLPYQDSHAVRYDPETRTHCIVIADGVSDVPLSHHAADIISDAVAQIATDLVADSSGAYRENGSLMNAKFLRELHSRTAGVYLDLCEETRYHPEEAAERFMATTIQVAVVTPSESLIVALSDGIVSFVQSYQAVSAVTERVNPGGNTPPLLERVIIAEAARQQEQRSPESGSEYREGPRLVREAESFHVVAYGESTRAVPNVIEMATDGGQFSDMLPLDQKTTFPLVRLAKGDLRSPPEIETAVLLSHVDKFGEKLLAVEYLQRQLATCVTQQSDSSVGAAQILTEVLQAVDPEVTGDARLYVRDYLRTLPGGREVTYKFSKDTSHNDFESALERLAKHVEVESFGQFLASHRVKLDQAILGVTADIAKKSEECGAARHLSVTIQEFVHNLRDSDTLAGHELQDWQWALAEADASTILHVVERERAALLDARREIVREAIAGARSILSRDFSIKPGDVGFPVFDDLTWFALGEP